MRAPTLLRTSRSKLLNQPRIRILRHLALRSSPSPNGRTGSTISASHFGLTGKGSDRQLEVAAIQVRQNARRWSEGRKTKLAPCAKGQRHCSVPVPARLLFQAGCFFLCLSGLVLTPQLCWVSTYARKAQASARPVPPASSRLGRAFVVFHFLLVAVDRVTAARTHVLLQCSVSDHTLATPSSSQVNRIVLIGSPTCRPHFK